MGWKRQIAKKIRRIEVTKIHDADVVVIKIDGQIGEDQLRNIKRTVESALGRHHRMVAMCDGIELDFRRPVVATTAPWLVEHKVDRVGLVHWVWMCEPPDPDSQFTVTDEEWNTDLTVRTIKAVTKEGLTQ